MLEYNIMKIGIDTFGCDHARSGLGTYLLSFISNLPKTEGVEFELFGSEIDRYTYNSGKDIPYTAVSAGDGLSAERLWHFTSCSKFCLQRGYDAVIFPAPERVLPINFKVPGIAVVNSVLSSMVEGRKDWIQKLQIKRGLLKVQKIIAASQFISDDLVSHGIEPVKIDVVHNGIDHKLFFPQIDMGDDSVNIKPFAIKKPYFIYGSRLAGPEKKHVELIKAFSLFKKKTGLPHRLVLAGSDGPYSSEVHKAAFESEFASDIFLTGYFPHESFPQLYAGSEALIFPSVSEGVGLPVLEAMATGVPVVCSSSCALPEIGSDSALYFDADNLESISDAMEKIATDSDLRSELVKKGLERASKFRWENTILQTVEIARKLIR